MHELLVNRLGGISPPRKSVVGLTYRPDMTLDVYRGRKTTIQQQQQLKLSGFYLMVCRCVGDLEVIIRFLSLFPLYELSHFRHQKTVLIHTLCVQLLLQFFLNHSETLQASSGWSVDVHVT